MLSFDKDLSLALDCATIEAEDGDGWWIEHKCWLEEYIFEDQKEEDHAGLCPFGV